MSRRRSPLTRTRTRKTAQRIHEVIERLEERRLLTTVITDTDPLTPTPATVTFEYKDARDVPVRVVVHGDVSAEFIFARVTKGDKKSFTPGNEVILGEHVLASNEDEDGRDLFHVYIAQASIDSYISIAEFDDSDNGPRPMTPFDGSVDLRINQLRTTDDTITTDGGTGSIYLGARTRAVDFPDLDDEDDVPIRADNFNGQGIAPVSIANRQGRLVAGVRTAPGVSIGRFLFGGTVSGNVLIDGTIDTFYCGQLLTGVTEGDFLFGSATEGPSSPDNFYVAGDLRNLLVKGSMGTERLSDDDFRTSPHYLSGFDLQVGGKVGQVKVGGSYTGFGEVANTAAGNGLRTRQQELEVLVPSGVNRGSFTEFENGQFGDNEGFFNNNTFDTAQFLGSINSKTLGAGSAQVNGLYQWVPRTEDTADFYGVALMAGQTVTVRLLAPIVFPTPTLVNGQLVTEIPSELHVGVYDPDRRLIATDYSNLGPESELNEFDVTSESDPGHFQSFSFTADRPGIYRVAVGKDPTFAAPGLRLGLEQPYQLQISGLGNLALGALSAGHNIVATHFSTINPLTGQTSPDAPALIKTIAGDLGALTTPGFILSNGGLNASAVLGNLRALDGVSLGFLSTETGRFGAGPNVQVTTGSIGLVRSSGTGGENFTVFNAANENPIGGDIQLIDTGNSTFLNARVNGSIGVIRAANMATADLASVISVNLDGAGAPGVIDLIDVPGDFGTLDSGGPLITVNRNGNVRYMHIGGTAFRPVTFGGSQPEETTYVQGQSADITDDSGAQVRITPTQQRSINPATGAVIDNSGTLTVLTYPIARSGSDTNGPGTGGGGSAIIRVTSTRGLTIETNGGSVEIGEVISQGTGKGLVVNQGVTGPDNIANSGDEPFRLNPLSTANNSLEFLGARTDIYRITGQGGFDFVRNNTPGEIVNMDSGAIGDLEAETLGWGRSSITPALRTEGSEVFAEGNTFPFVNARTAVRIFGGSELAPAIVNLRARQFIGNVAITGIVQNAEANWDNRGTKGVHEGINGPFFVLGQLRRIMIGEGLLQSGTGDMGHAGVYVAGTGGFNGHLGELIGQGPGSDVRGDVVAGGNIGQINLNGGSIINADIFVGHAAGAALGGPDLAFSREFSTGNIQFEPNGRIEQINIGGMGGIIGGNFIATNMGTINVSEGFGIINSRFLIQGNGRFGQVTAGGYGVRGVDWLGGQSVDGINAVGQGRLSTNNVPAGVRLSETTIINPYTGTRANILNDLHAALGTSKDDPKKKGATSKGTIKAIDVRVSRDVGSVVADSISTSVFNVGNNIANLTSASYTERVVVTAGRLDSLHIGKDAIKTDVSISGPVDNVYIGGSFKGSSSLAAAGANGTINRFVTNNTLYGNVSAEKQINSIRVGTHYGSQGTHSGGNILEFITNGDLLTTSVLSASKTLNKLIVGGDFQDGAIVKVRGLGTKTVIGADEGEVVLR